MIAISLRLIYVRVVSVKVLHEMGWFNLYSLSMYREARDFVHSGLRQIKVLLANQQFQRLRSTECS